MLRFIFTFLLLTSYQMAFSAPQEVYGYLRMSIFEYHTRYYDENGNVKVYPRQTQIDLTADEPEAQTLFADDTPLGQDIIIHFESNTDWQNAIYKVAKTHEMGNPNREQDLIWTLQENTIVIDAKSAPLDGYNGQHQLVVKAHGYKPRFITIHLVKDAPRVYVSNGRKPVTGQELTLKLKNFSYRIINPIHEVQLDGKVLHNTDYRVISNLVTLEKHVVRTPGLHTITIKAWGYQDANRTLKFSRGQPPLPEPPVVENETPAESHESGPFMNAAVVFNFDMVSNAYILKKLSLETNAVSRIIAAWEYTDKTMLRAAGQTQFYSWEDYSYETMEAEVVDSYLSFQDFIKLQPNEYPGRPYQVKFMFADGHFGDAIAFNQAIAVDPPIVDTEVDSMTGSILIRAEAPSWFNKIQRVKVGATQLWDYEYEINNGAIRILNRDRFMVGDNRVTIVADGYRDLKLNIVLDSM